MRSKYEATLFECLSCGFVFFNEAPWLAEAYKDPIDATDTGYVARNLHYSTITATLIRGFLNPQARFLDYGAGYGLFVRLMRDTGIDFRWQDSYTANLFARGFEWKTGEEIEAVTAFEVFEHLISPANTVSEISKMSDVILFSTNLLPSPAPKAKDWWYFALSCGQHVSFYSENSLQILAEQFGYQFLTDGKSLHAFHKGKLSANSLRRSQARWFQYYQRRLLPLRSLIWTDHSEIEGGTLEKN
ncbi:MAG: class I SAM-dependent methyltransferase [Prosthecobacter sp.]